MKLFKRKGSYLNGRNTKYELLQRAVSNKADVSGKKLCLDVGSGDTHDPNYTSVDIKDSCNPDILVDIRTMFAASDVYREKRNDYPDAAKLEQEWDMIRLLNVVEHVEWIYQKSLYAWLYSVLAPNGLLYISTPNLEYLSRLYVSNIERIKKGMAPAFPSQEHDSFTKERKPYDATKYFNFKVHSGCSWMDYHHASLDKYWLVGVLGECGFIDIKYCDFSHLSVLATKPPDKDNTVVDAVEQTISEWEGR